MRAMRAWMVAIAGVWIASSPGPIRGQQAKEELSKEERAGLEKRVKGLHERLAKCYGQGQLDEALWAGRRAVGICERLYPTKEFPNGHPALSLSLSNTGAVLLILGKAGQALPYLEKALALDQKLFPPSRFENGHFRVANSLYSMGRVLAELGESAKAVPFYEKAVAMQRKLYPESRFPDGHSELAASLSSLGAVLDGLGEPAKALPFCEQAVAMNRKLYPESRFPDGRPELAASLNNLGAALIGVGQPGKALVHLEKAVAINRKTYPKSRFPDGHPALAQSRHNLGVALSKLDEPAKAVVHLEKVVAMNRKLYPESHFPNGHLHLANSLNSLGSALQDLGESVKALSCLEKAVAMNGKLYPASRFPNGHPHLAESLSNLGTVLHSLGEDAKSLSCMEKAVTMNQKLYPASRFPDGHPLLADSLNKLGGLWQALGEPAKALPSLERAMAMNRKVYPASRFPDGHPSVANGLAWLGAALYRLGEPAKARVHLEQAVAMNRKLYPESRFPDGHPSVAVSRINLSAVLVALGEPATARGHLEKAVAMNRKLYPETRFADGHPALSVSLTSLGKALSALGESARALPYVEKAVAMNRKLYPPSRFEEGHPVECYGLTVQGMVLHALGEHAKALRCMEKAAVMHQKYANREIAAAPEAQALASLVDRLATRDRFVSAALGYSSPASCYGLVWSNRSSMLRLLLRRSEAARVARSRSTAARRIGARLAEIRRDIGRLLLAPGEDLKRRDRLLSICEEEQQKLERQLLKLLPELAEHKSLAQQGPANLAAQLQANTVFVDLVRIGHYPRGRFAGFRYLAFVLPARGRVGVVDLGDAKGIDTAVLSWRRSIQKGEESTAPVQLRERVWEKIERKLPAGTKTVYLCPDGQLSRLPFGALPGRKKGTVVLEEYGIAVVPGGLWLLRALGRPAAAEKKESLLVVGDVEFGPIPAGKAGYAPLPETGREWKRVWQAFGKPTRACLSGKSATIGALLERLPGATVAHLATHGYFDEPALREEHRRAEEMHQQWTFQEGGTARVGLGARNPLAFVGLVLAGANEPDKADRRGIVTGLDLLELPLDKLRLCVLSACETGVGQWSEHGGVAGLQRALHVAGCRNAVGSLWKVNDAATAALMTCFYHELQSNKRTPLEALREAQLTIYRHPERIKDLAGERGRPALEKPAQLGSGPREGADATKGKKAETKLWAAFVLSGTGR